MRRRLIAAGIAAAALIVLVVLLTRDGRDSVMAGATGRAVGPLSPPLVAQTAAKHVKQPWRLVGDGPFMTIEGRTVKLLDVPNPGRKVALTFDDGPAPLTPRFLDKLARLRAPASFFLVGVHVGEHPELVRRERDMGMTIGNHTYGHLSLPSLGPRDQRIELARTQGMIDEAIGRRPFFFRPPGQEWSYEAARQIAQQGMVGVRFSIDTQDWRPVGTRAIVENALKAKPGDVIQMHDGGPNREQTLRAVGPIVRGLRKRGFKLVTLDDLYRPVAKQQNREGRRSR